LNTSNTFAGPYAVGIAPTTWLSIWSSRMHDDDQTMPMSITGRGRASRTCQEKARLTPRIAAARM
jgi:hypothetical protein